ncbi:PREDICTED: methyl-CpG-binding domain-containing protein 2-like [Nelumbo nucifera]|uniref:Methyl-CpG-binding domain-containing protein 2-like n=1 Tax=Nelumbo nucifera TaxID=4432 RepID=A0A1U8A188_NELNU|nr:PREDICTED: methyl-CpG-binding domain-containing protein 2-like [Nelumbo nucifera]XP_010259933.1 PREDICTED: methyl-CpG-binding domain-containing protein 2-like [Nelumbo nucifera]
MWSHHGDASTKLKKEKDELIESSSPSCLGNTIEKPGYDSTLEGEEEEETQVNEDEDDQSNRNTSKQLVLYDPEATPTGQIQPSHEPVSYQPPPLPTCSTRNPLSRALPSIGAFTVQCANCFKWRLIPTKEKYEEIRESILQKPFVCETAREWRPDISCDDPADISQDGSRLWAIDKPNIAQPPLGWERLLRIRGEGSTKFADVYYVSPSGKRLRSMVEVQRYLLEHPEYTDAGVTMAQFSFQTPRPLQENYVRKRPAPVAPSYDESDLGISRPIEPRDVNPLSWAGPIGLPEPELQLGGPGLSTPSSEFPVFEPVARPVKKRTTRLPSKKMSRCNPVYSNQKVKSEDPERSQNNDYDL